MYTYGRRVTVTLTVTSYNIRRHVGGMLCWNSV